MGVLAVLWLVEIGRGEWYVVCRGTEAVADGDLGVLDLLELMWRACRPFGLSMEVLDGECP